MSTSTQPLSNDARVPLSRVSLNSSLTNLILDSDTNQSSFLVVTNNSPSLYIDKFQNIGINTTSPTHQLDINSSNGSCLRLIFNNTSNTAQFSVSNSGILTITPSGEEIQIPTAKNLNIKSHNGTTGLKLNDTLVTSSATQLNYVNVTAGTVSASKALVVNATRDIGTIRNITSDGLITSVGVTSSGVVDITNSTASTSTTTGALKVTGGVGIGGTTNIGGALSVTGNITGTLVTASQPNITSVGTLTSLNISSSAMPSMHIQSSYVTGVTSSSIASEYDIILRRSTASNLTMGLSFIVSTNDIVPGGTITFSRTGTNSAGDLIFSTKNTSGTLSEHLRITSNGRIGIRTNAPDRQLEINASDGNCLRLTYNTSSGSATNYIDQTISSTGIATFNVVGSSPGFILSGGNISITNTTSSTSNATGALIVSGGIGITNTTDATSSTNGGTFTTAGGVAIAKKLFVGTDLSVMGNTSISGNLTVSGTTTTVNTTNTLIKDNTILLNSGPSGTGIDAGLLTERYQVDIDNGTGDIVNDPAKETYAISSATSTTLVLPLGANTTNDYYKNWWIKMTSGNCTNQVRKVTGYVGGATRTLTLSSAFTTNTPSTGNNVNLYNKTFTSFLWQESNKQFITAFTSNDTSSSALTVLDYANLQTNNLTSQNITANGIINITDSTSSSSTTTGALKVTGGVGIGGALNVGGNIAGTLATAAQPSITSVGTLTGLTSSGAISITDSTSSSSTTTGALKVTGGVGIGGALNVGGNIAGTLATAAQPSITSVGTLTGLTSSGAISITDSTSSSSTTTGALKVTGGVGIGGALNVGGNITGTLATAAQTNITSVGTLTGLTSSGAISITNSTSSSSTSTGALKVTGGVGIGGALNVGGNITGTLATAAQTNITSVGTLTGLTSSGAISITNSTASSSTSTGALIVTGGVGIGGALNVGGALSVTGNITGTLATAAQPSITSVGTLTGLTSSGAVSITNSTTSTTTGTGALIITGGVGIGGALNVGGNITGTLATAAQPSITSVGTLTGLTSSGAVSITNSTTSTTTGTGALIITGGVGIGGALNVGGALSVTGNITGTLATAAQPSITSVGTLTGLTSSGVVDITNSTASTTTTTGALKVVGGVGIGGALNVGGNITGTLATAAQPNITSVGTLTSLSTGSITLNGTLITATAADINSLQGSSGAQSSYITGITEGTASASKALVVDTNKDITGIRNLTATNLTGTLQTAAQANITSVGTLTGLTSSGAVSITNATASSSILTGALVVTGGVGIGGASYIGGSVRVNSSSISSSSVSGALVVNGGVGIGNNLNVALAVVAGLSGVSGAVGNSTSGIQFRTGATSYTTGYTGTLASTVFSSFARPTWLASTAGTVTTEASTVYIENSPLAGTNMTITNAYALCINAGVTALKDTTASSSTTSGALIVTGGVGIGGALNVGGNITGTLATAAQSSITSVGTLTGLTSSGAVSITNSTASTTTSTGALIVTGGVGIGGALNVGGALSVTGNITGTLATAAQSSITSVGTLTGLTSSGAVSITNSTASTTTSTGALIVTGGVGIGGALNVGGALSVTGNITGTLATAAQTSITSVGTLTGLTSSGTVSITNSTASTTTSTGALIVTGGVGIGGALNVGGALSVTGNITGTLATAAQTSITSVGTLTGLTSSGAVSITDTTISTSTTTGALVVSGGVGINGNVNIGGNRTLASWSLTGPQFNVAANTFTESSTTASGTNNAELAINSFQKSTLAASNTNVTFGQTIANVYIADGPNAGTNATITRKCALLTGGAIAINPGSLSISNWSASLIHFKSGTSTTVINDTGASNITGIVGTNEFNGVLYTSSTAGRTMTRAATIHIINQPSAGTNMTITNRHALYVAAGNTTLADSTASTTTSSGALVVTGGVGIGGALNIGNTSSITSANSNILNLSSSNTTVITPNSSNTNVYDLYLRKSTTTNGQTVGIAFHVTTNGVDAARPGGSIIFTRTSASAGDISFTTDSSERLKISSAGVVSISSTTISSGLTTGALVVSGGVGISGRTYSSRFFMPDSLYGLSHTYPTGGEAEIVTYTNGTSISYIGTFTSHSFGIATSGSTRIRVDTVGDVSISSTNEASSSTAGGALTISGGAAIAKKLFVGSDLSVSGNITGTLATAAQGNITSVGTLTGLTSSGIVSITNTTDSTSSSTGALVLSGGIGINDTADAVSSINGGSLTTAGGMAIAKKLFVGTDVSVGGNLTVTGNLTISGTTTTVDTTATLIKDNTLTLNSGPAGTGYDSGVLIQRFQDENNAGTGDVVNDTAEETYAISSATSTTVTLPSGANTTADYYKDWYIKITSGAGNNQVRKVIGYTGSTTRVLTLNTSFATTPSASDTINLYNKPISTILWQESNKQFITAFTSTDVSAGALSIIDYADLRTNILNANRIRVGDSTDTNTSRMISALDSTITTGSTNRLIAIGKASSANNQAEMMFNWTADGSSSNNLRLGLHSAGSLNSTFILGNGNVGIGTSLPDRKLEINSSTGNCLRLTYNDTDGTATTYCDQTISSAGVVTLAAAGSAPSFVMSGGAVSITNTTASTSKTTGALTVSGGVGVGGAVTANSLEAVTAGSTNVILSGSASKFRLMAHTDNVCYIQTGDSSGTTNSSRDLFIGDYGKATANLTSTNRRFIIKGGVVGTNADAGFVGIGTIVPSKQLEVRNATGDCLRLSYDDTDYFDTTVSSTGVTTWTATGSASRFTFAGTSLITLPDNTSFKLTSDIGVSDDHLLHFNSSKVVCIGKNTVSNTSNWLEVAPAGGALFGGDVNIEGVLNVNGASNAYFGSNAVPIATTFIGGSGDVLTIDGTGSGTGGRNTILFKGNAYTWEFGTRNSTANPNNAMYFFSKKNDGTENAYRMTMLVDGKIGLGTTVPATQLEINSATGSCLQLTYNDSNGGATTYCRQEVSSTGVVTFTAAGSAPSFTMAGGEVDITDNTSSTSTTTGALVVSGGIGLAGNMNLGGVLAIGRSARSTPAWGVTGAQFNTNATTYTDTSSTSGTVSSVVFNSFARPTLTTNSATTPVTYTNAATVYINNSPTVSGTGNNLPVITNAYSLWIASGRTLLADSTASSSTTTGALVVTGGIGIGGNSTIGGALSITDTTASTSATTGALKVSGGAGLSHLVIGGNRSLATWSTTGALFRTVATTLTDTSTVASGDAVWLAANVFATPTFAATNTNVTVGSGAVNLYVNGPPSQGTNMTFTRSYALYVNGNMYMGATKSIREWNMGIQLMTSGGLVTDAITAASGTISTFGRTYEFGRSTFAATNTSVTLTNAATVYIDNAPINGTNMTITNAYALYAAAGKVRFADSTASSSTTTGALTVTGGVGIGGNLNVGGDIVIGVSGAGPNELRFAGTTGDTPNNFTVITERIYTSTERSELLLFKGNDTLTTSGPDRIRLRGGALVFQVHDNEDYSTLADDRTVLYIGNDRVALFGKTTASNANNWLEVASGTNGYSALFDGRVGIGTGATNPRCPLDIGISNSDVFASATYAYNNGGSSWTVITANASGVSLRTSGRIYCGGELDIVSDYRLKQNIQNITLEMSKKFIMNIVPKTFNYKKEPDITSFGYIAQDILKNEFRHLVQVYANDDVEEDTDHDNFTSPKGKSFAVSLTNIIPILHVTVKDLCEEKNKLEEKVSTLEAENQLLKQQIQSILQRLDNLESN